MIRTITGIFNRNFVLLSAYGMLALALSLMLVTNLPLYLEEAGWDPRAIGTILGSYFLTSLIVRPFVGREADRRGRKVIMVAGGVLMLLPLPLYLMADSSAIILVARVLQGIGWAMATTAAAALASEVVPQDRVGMGLGIFGVLNSLGFTFGPTLGSYLLNAFGGEGLLLGAAGLAGGGRPVQPPVVAADAAGAGRDSMGGCRTVRPSIGPATGSDPLHLFRLRSVSDVPAALCPSLGGHESGRLLHRVLHSELRKPSGDGPRLRRLGTGSDGVVVDRDHRQHVRLARVFRVPAVPGNGRRDVRRGPRGHIHRTHGAAG